MNKSIYRVVLVVLLGILGVTSARATDFISDIKFGVHDHSEATTKGYLTNNGYTVIDVELNNNENKSGEAWVFLGYKTTTDPSKAITDIMIVSGGNSETYLSGYSEADGGITFAGDSRKWYRCPSEGSSADINRFNGGDYLTIYYTRDNCVSNGGSPLTALSATTSKGLSGWTYSNLWKGGSISAYGSTNTGTTGKATYIIYQTHTHSFTSYPYNSTQHKYGCAECGYVESTVDHTLEYKSNGNGTMTPYCFCGFEDEYPGFFRGDVNCDGKIDISDVSELIRVLNGKASATGACKVNDDTVVDIKDVQTLKDNILNDAARVWVKINAITGGSENTGDAPKVAETKMR